MNMTTTRKESENKKKKDTNRIFLKLTFDFYVDESKATDPNGYYAKVDGVRLALEQAIKHQIPEKFGVEIHNFIIGTDSFPMPGEGQPPGAGDKDDLSDLV
jgi:hypothetical protein